MKISIYWRLKKEFSYLKKTMDLMQYYSKSKSMNKSDKEKDEYIIKNINKYKTKMNESQWDLNVFNRRFDRIYNNKFETFNPYLHQFLNKKSNYHSTLSNIYREINNQSITLLKENQ